MRGVAPNRRPVNMVFQHLALFPMMSGRRERGLRSRAPRRGARGAHAPRPRRCSSASAWRRAGHKRVDELSGGQRQRVAIARSLVLEPTLLLLDEPLGALDLKLREHMKIELKQLQAAFGTTFVYITHDQSEALVLSDHVGVMNRGRFEQLGTPQELYYSPATPFVAASSAPTTASPARPSVSAARWSTGRHGERLADSRAQAAARLQPATCGRGFRASGSGDDRRTHAELAALAGQIVRRAKSRACCSTAPIPRC
jgi:spermidine/putrescine transport system ATP-binding protein